jgi:hypothetical protein
VVGRPLGEPRWRVVADYAKNEDPYAHAAMYFGLTVNQADLCFGWDRWTGICLDCSRSSTVVSSPSAGAGCWRAAWSRRDPGRRHSHRPSGYGVLGALSLGINLVFGGWAVIAMALHARSA